jgi:hypothetical protein
VFSHSRVAFCSVAFGLFFLVPNLAAADAARVEALGGVALFTEDSSFAFTNPADIGVFSNRAWFSLGLTGSGGVVGVDPHGGAAVTIKEVFTLGVALNRSPTLYGFDAALWPVALAYMPDGPGGPLGGADGPTETSEALRFPLDLFVGFGDESSKTRFGMNFYYAGGSSRVWDIDDSDQDDLEQSTVVGSQTHLFNATLGLSRGTRADRTRPEVWLRVGNLTSWRDSVSTVETSSGDADTVIDQVLALDRDLRVGGGARVKIGDASEGLVVSPGLTYDIAFGTFRYDDNLISPNSRAERSARDTVAHDLRAGVGLAWRGDGLLVQGSISAVMRLLQTVDAVDVGDGQFQQTTTKVWDVSLPELALGAEYEVLPWLLVRGGMRSSVVGGLNITSENRGVGPAESPVDFAASQDIQSAPVSVAVDATGGVGLRIKRFSLDAIVGGIFVGDGPPNLLSRVDISFSFD